MHHLIQNAQEATESMAGLKLLLKKKRTIRITIEDNGCGMTEEFINSDYFAHLIPLKVMQVWELVSSKQSNSLKVWLVLLK